MARWTDRVWITPQYIAKRYPRLNAQNLKSWRKRGCLALENGRKLRHKPNPKYIGQYLYHHDDIERIAATPRINKNGRLKAADGDWLLQSAAIKAIDTGIVKEVDGL